MKEMLRYGLILGVICLVASGLLVGVYSLTRPRIVAQAQNEEEEALLEVLPGAIRFEPVKSDSEIIYYKGYGQDGRLKGVAFKVSAKGYSSTIETMVGMDKEGTISAIKILSQNETPGLGAGITEPSFTGQFKNKDTKSLTDVEAITGATISSGAVIDSVKAKAQEIKELIKDE